MVDDHQVQLWELLSVDGQLLLGGYYGVYRFDGEAVSRVSVGTPVTELEVSRHRPGLLFVGRANGLGVLRSEGGRWIDLGLVQGLDEQVATLAEAQDGTLWASSRSKGLLRLSDSTRVVAGSSRIRSTRMSSPLGTER